ncbi:hypothetical protein M422DRAFT_33957 [Sphaerobolus stellatus SS14]|uniref:Uncharacterized protein n=1 Tax=Sphaerobolus stellatus (strain SS14) TaxID=990650 RepID=A0A0C9U2N7_SPHS4|nr:hypothetical protein M422DRAFT_33957 [Sphaerobolus stellatus SS14]
MLISQRRDTLVTHSPPSTQGSKERYADDAGLQLANGEYAEPAAMLVLTLALRPKPSACYGPRLQQA